jgi:hypothetical protein
LAASRDTPLQRSATIPRLPRFFSSFPEACSVLSPAPITPAKQWAIAQANRGYGSTNPLSIDAGRNGVSASVDSCERGMSPPGVLATCSPRGSWCSWGGDAVRSSRGAKHVGPLSAAAEGGSGANLFRRSGLTVATAGRRLDSRNEVRNDLKTVPGDPWRGTHKAVGGPSEQCMLAELAPKGIDGARRTHGGRGERLPLVWWGNRKPCRRSPGGGSRVACCWPGSSCAGLGLAVLQRGKPAAPCRRGPAANRWRSVRGDGRADLCAPAAKPDRLADVGRWAVVDRVSVRGRVLRLQTPATWSPAQHLGRGLDLGAGVGRPDVLAAAVSHRSAGLPQLAAGGLGRCWGLW